MTYDPNKVDPIHYPVYLSAVRRTTAGRHRYLDILDANEERITSVEYSDRRPGDHFTCMRTAQAIVDALNYCRINIVTDGAIHVEAPQPKDPDANLIRNWRERALMAETQVRHLERRVSDMGWEMDNHRQEAQRRRDREIREMGGGG